jgi:ribosomal protein S18 acetylase RimI-like enzyme
MYNSGHTLRRGTSLERALLVKFMQLTYEELYPGETFAHLAQTVDQYFSGDTPLWWAEVAQEPPNTADSPPEMRRGGRQDSINTPVGCLWLGNAIDQVTGRRYSHIFLLYVAPAYRRRGIGSALIHRAEAWAQARGDQQVGLQVFQHNMPALRLYEKLGYQPQSIWMVKAMP